MNKAISYILIGAVGATAVIMYMQNKDDLRYKMHQLKQAGLDKINKVKASME